MIQVLVHSKVDRCDPGTWIRVTLDNVDTARVSCPACGKVGLLADHVIDGKGEVLPSVVCDCGYHEFIVLEGWPLMNGGM